MKVYGIKRLRESEIGNDSSHQAHIGLFQDVIVSQGHHQKLIANLYFDDRVYTTLAFLDFIQNDDGTLRSPKIRKGNQDDNYIVNGVSYNSLVVEILNLIHSGNTDLNWYILYTQSEDNELEFYLFTAGSVLYNEINGSIGISDRKKFIKSREELSYLQNILINTQQGISVLDSLPDLNNPSYEIKIRKKEYDTYVANKVLRDAVVSIYNGKCQICDKKYVYINSLGDIKEYAEGAHIKAKNPNIGGSDSLDNLLCLCASCHALFDLGAYWVDEIHVVKDINGKIVNQLTIKHEIDDSNFLFHRNFFENRRNFTST